LKTLGVDSIKLTLEKARVNWIKVPQGRFQWQHSMNTMMNFRVP